MAVLCGFELMIFVWPFKNGDTLLNDKNLRFNEFGRSVGK